VAVLEVFEVFGQERPGAAYCHAGSLQAADPALARVLARELFCRRSEYVSLWVVARPAVLVVPRAGEPPGPSEPRSYRLGSGYRGTVDKWKRFGGDQRADR
jgi:ring-1,2-phenylacetyl-CoA epoxidase subunit PaaB